MRVPYSWLKDYYAWDGEIEDLARRLTQSGLEVEEIEQWSEGGAEDQVLITKVTSNRGDLLSIVGLARHAAATVGGTRFPLEFSLPPAGPPAADEVVVQIDDPIGCPRYSAMLVRGVKIGESPDWMKERLAAAGMRPISNVVDCTNYVMFELGQPLHAFDAQLLGRDEQGRTKIIVRRAAPGEKLLTLDGQERPLEPTDVVIADPRGAVALAGVMGGQSSEVIESTMDVLIESAHFDPVAIRKTSQRLGLISEASHRFERTVDPGGTVRAAERCAELMVETAGGEVAEGVVDEFPGRREPLVLELRPSRANALLGTDLSTEMMAEYLRRLDMETTVAEPGDEALLRVTVPTFRPDLEREVDLVEEVLYVHGYDTVQGTLPGKVTHSGMYTERQRKRRRLGELLRAGGLCESINVSMVHPEDLTRIGLPEDAPERRMFMLQRPTDEGLSAMRTTLFPSLLGAAERNANQRVTDVALYEIDPVFLPSEDGQAPQEPLRVALLVMGNVLNSRWNTPPEVGVADFYLLKGIVQQTLDAMGVTGVTWEPGAHPTFRPGHCAEVKVEGQRLGVVGEVAARVQEEFDLPRKTFLAELDADLILDCATLFCPYEHLARYPAALRDLAIVVADTDECSAARVEEVIREAGGELLVAAEPFDVFVNEERLGQGNRSIAFSLEFRAPDRTLTDDEVNTRMAAITQALVGKLGATIRTA
jgi:phenylalanyl-tRNA synthetase beta chain